MKRAALIHDISGFGKCSLTVAIPILSAAGIETCPVPTAVLSTHTGEFEGYTYRDLTDDMPAYIGHWKSLGIHFDALYSGYLGSARQAGIVADMIDSFRKSDTVVMVDPAMADNGEMYKMFDAAMCDAMRELVKKSDIAVPNVTEAAFLTGTEYRKAPHDREYIDRLLTGMTRLGVRYSVITGVETEDGKLGAACRDSSGETVLCVRPRVEGTFYGTGDVFASFLLGGIMNGMREAEAVETSVDLVYECTRRTHENKTPLRDGVVFEEVLPEMMKRFGVLK